MAETAKRFETLDLYLSSFIFLQGGQEPELIVKNGKVVFSFVSDDQLYRVMGLYNSNLNVPVTDFVTSIKVLRGKMLSMRQGIYDNGKGMRHGQFKD